MKHKKTNNDDNDIEWDKHLCIREKKMNKRKKSNSNREENKTKKKEIRLTYSDTEYNDIWRMVWFMV